MSCGIANGIAITCDDLKKVGGINKLVWIFNISDLADTKYTETSDYISAINFDTYKGTYSFTGKKKSHSFGSQIIKQQPGGNTFFQHDAIIKLFPDNPTEDSTIENLAVGEIGLIVEDNNQQFFLLGAENGMEVIEGTQNSGQENASDVALSITMQGEEKKRPRRISVDGSGSDYAATKAYLETLVV